MVGHVFDLYGELERRRIMLAFTGDLTPELVSAVLDAVERKLEVIGTEARSRKRVFNVVMECLQNLYHHNKEQRTASSTPERPKGVVLIAQSPNGYSVITGNAMAQEEVESLKTHLDRINDLDAEQLRHLYKDTLDDGRFSRAGGAGLGIIDMARKSGSKLEYGFVPLDDENTFFSLNVNVNT